jgi:glycosyltransferase involved in cell wall biosynthesis
MKIVMLVSKRTDPRTFNEAYTLVNAGHEVTIVTWDRELRFPKREEVIEGYKMHRIQFNGTYGRGIWQIPGFARFWFLAFLRLVTWKYDVVYCHDLDTYPLGWLAARLRRKKVVFDAHIPLPERMAWKELESPMTRHFVRFIEMIERLLAKRADVVFTDSEKVVDRFREMGVKNVYEILNVPRRDFPYTPKVHRDGAVTIGRIGLMSRIIGHGADDTIDAFERLLNEGYDVRLALLGNITPGEYKEELTERIRRFGDRVTFSDFIPYSEVMEWYGKLDISVILYDHRIHRCMYRLGYPVKLFESMAAGLPMILRSNAHAQQLLLDKECGIVVGYELESVVNGLRTLIEDPELRIRYGANARRAFEERYNWAYESQRLLKALEPVLSANE